MSVATDVLGAGLKVAGIYTAGQAQEQSYEAQADAARYQAAVAENNKIVAKQNARLAKADSFRLSERASAGAYMQDLKTAQVLGEQTAAQSASGIDVQSGSSQMVRTSTHMLGRADAKQIFDNTQLDSFNSMIRQYGYKTQAKSAEASAGLYEMQAQSYEDDADAASLATWINMGSSIIGSATDITKKWGTFGAGGGNTYGTGLY